MTLVGYLYVVLFLCISTYLAARNPKRALLWAVALLPWFGLDMDIGLRVTAFQLFILPIVIIYVIRGLPISLAVGQHVVPLALFIGYALAVTFVMLPFLPEVEIAGGVLRTPIARSLVQILVLLFTVLPLLLGARLLRTQQSLVDVARIYLGSSLLLAAIGYLQMGIWYATGENPLPIAYFDTLVTGKADQYRSGAFPLEDITVFRMNSLGGEPKHLGQALVVAFLILTMGFNVRLKPIASMFAAKATFLLVAIFLTQSTSAFMLLVAGLLGIFAFGSGALKGLRVARVLAIAAAIALAGSAIVTYWLNLPVAELIAARTSERFYASEYDYGFLDDFDAAVVSYLSGHWISLLFGVGLGNVHLFADSYLAPRVAAFAGGTSFVAKMGLLRIVSETGLIGAVLFLLFVFRLCVAALQQERNLGFTFLIIAALAYFLVGHASLFYIVAGAIIGMISAQQIQVPATTRFNLA